jgi:hypothetical protein
MTTALLLSVLVWLPMQDAGGARAQAAQQRDQKEDQKDEKKERPKRGDIVLARGCVRGGVLESASLASPSGSDHRVELISFRMTGDRKLLDEIRKDHDRHGDIITGELRTDLPMGTETLGKKIGNTRIVIGAGPSRPMMPEGPPPMPVLKVTSFEHTSASCR